MKISAFFSRQKEDSMESANLPSLSINDKKVYEALFNNHIDLTFILDRDGTILNINEATSKTTGYSKKDMIGESFIPFVVEEYLDTSMELFNRVLKGKTQNSIFAIKAKSGDPILVNCITIPITDEGEVVGAIGISKNITEEENLKKELDLNEQKYRSLFENHPDAVYLLGLDGAFVDCNDSLCRFLGYSREELAYSFHSLVAEEYLDYTNECFAKAAEGSPQNYNSVGIHKNGQRVAVNITNIPMMMDGKIVGVFGIAKDITRSRAQEEALHKVQDSLVHAQKMANIGSWDYDYEANEAYWSLQMYKIFGMNPHAEFKASYETYLEFIHPSDRMRFISIFQQAIKNRKSFSIEYKIIRMDDEVRIVHQQSDILLKPSGEISRIIGTIHDITERRYAEKKLVESEKQFRNIYNNLDVAIWSIDILEPRVLFCSKGVENIFGYPASYFEECIEQLMNAIYPEDFLAIKNEFKQMKQGKTVKKQCRIFHSTGEIRWIEASIIPIIEEGQFLRIDGITTDITEQKRNQEVMNHLAHHDYLTDLPNRRKFDEELKLLIEECPSFAILYLDLDRFKHINDTLGHTIGDELLIEVANRLRTHSNQQMFISRMAGDEFSVLLKEPEDLDDAIKAGWSIGKPSRSLTLYRTMNFMSPPASESASTQRTAMTLIPF
ncbi:PAS domain S-box protein [Falsibacillus pallidus]|uniref:PAS domain S-box-containing protein/diguanylate cyclase (GGDEF)-like protein n=1 Tax=Falsibacillus pallidus TaxID=493781 RepID=A0A370G9N6_9BACI|nr:PAS domain S-box protein [Falsibacillus pallidus]RDI39896.1 PAS domain S-box-containing protein/diguanylate cyclase (GGDEF)-like protein [Falsibacillus pallidus]